MDLTGFQGSILPRGCGFVLALLAAYVVVGSAHADECIDYGQYLHRVGAIQGDVAVTVEVAGTHAYVTHGDTLRVIDTTNPGSPVITGQCGTHRSSDIDVEGDFAYLAGSSGFQVVDVADPSFPVLVGGCDTSHSALGVEVAGTFAYVTTDSSMQIIDITSPTSPVVVGSIDIPRSTRAVGHSGDHVFTASSISGLQVVDVTDPSHPMVVGSVVVSGVISDIVVSEDRAYIATGTSLEIADISNPVLPVIIGSCDGPPDGLVSRVCLNGGYVFVAAQMGGLQVIDVSDPFRPLPLAVFPTFWPALDVVADGFFAFVASGSFEVFNIWNPYDSPLTGHLEQIASAVAVAGSYAYVAADSLGLSIIDISSPGLPSLVSLVPTAGRAYALAVASGYAYLVTAVGLEIVDIDNLAHVGSISLPMGAKCVAVMGDFAYVGARSGLQVIDVSNPATPQVVATVEGTGSILAIASNQPYVYLAAMDLTIVDITNPLAPELVATVDLPGGIVGGISVDGPLAYIAATSGLRILDVSSPTHPVEVGAFASAHCTDVAVADIYAYVSDGATVQVVDVSEPSSPRLVGGRWCSNARDLGISGDNLIATRGTLGLDVLPQQCVAPAPDLTLGVLQNPYLTQNLDLYLVSSAALDHARIRISGEQHERPLSLTDPAENVWSCSYRVTADDAVMSLEACASSTTGRTTCLRREFSVRLLKRGIADVITSPDGDLMLSVHSPGLARDALIMVMPVTAQGVVQGYAVSPEGVLGGTSATLEMRYSEKEADPSRLCIEEESQGPLMSLVNLDRRTVMATIGNVGTFRLTAGPSGSSRIRERAFLRVEPNIPNPFNPVTRIRFEVQERQRVRVSVFDVCGREVRCLMDQVVAGGIHEVLWDGNWQQGGVASGVYLCKVQTEETSRAQKMLLLK